jgi:hypothetical protein
MVPLYVIERIGGADISQSEEDITIQKGGNTMLLTLNSTQASLNESLITLPQAPVQVNDVVMVPIRAVLEQLLIGKGKPAPYWYLSRNNVME